MNEPIVTFGLLMGMEVESKQDTGAGGSGKEVLLAFCPTGESEEGTIDITPRLLDLEPMGFRPVTISRWNPVGPCNYTIIAKEGLSEALQNAVFNDTWILLHEA
jgi:hypothetical protein